MSEDRTLEVTTSQENVDFFKDCEVIEINDVPYIKVETVYEFLKEWEKLNVDKNAPTKEGEIKP